MERMNITFVPGGNMVVLSSSISAKEHSHPHNNTMSRNEKFWVDPVTVPRPPPPPGERQRGGGVIRHLPEAIPETGGVPPTIN